MAEEKEKDKDKEKSQPSREVQALQEYYTLMSEEGLDAIEVKSDDRRVKLVRATSVRQAQVVYQPPRGAAVSSAAPAATATAGAPAATEKQEGISSPLAGVFYRASSPATPPFTKEGDVVDPGQTLCIVEAMKVMNEIKAETRCRILKITAENSRPVTAGQMLFLTEPA